MRACDPGTGRFLPAVQPLADGLKECAKCGRAFPANTDHFKRNRSVASGLDAYCRPCRRAYQAEWWANLTEEQRAEYRRRQREATARRRKADPEAERERHRRDYERRRNDPATWAHDLFVVAMRYRRNREAAGYTLRAASFVYPARAHRQDHDGAWLPAEPLADFLRREFRWWTYSEIARRVGVDQRTVARLINGTATRVSLGIADRILTNADCMHLLSVLYPAEDVAA